MESYCQPCKTRMECVFKEQLGESFWCTGCGATIVVSFDKGLITIESLGDKLINGTKQESNSNPPSN